MNTVLVVDDDPAVGKVLGALLHQDGLRACHAASGVEALKELDRQPVDVVITDLRMPGMDGMELLTRVHRQLPDLPVVMLTAHGTVDLAVEAMKAGASEFMLKPFDRQEILYVIRKVMKAASRRADAVPRTFLAGSGIIGDSPAMDEVHRMIRRAAASDSTVLVRGESGTGKELVVRAIHQQSPRRKGPLIKVHCAALPDTLLESELFGYEKGAFSGATSRKPGRVELAHGGTLFLDEIGDISPAVQVKLLRVLQERQLERLGGTKTITVDVRFVAATHRDLESMLSTRDFREDLFYRLNVVPVWLPPLRDRGQDIELLARHFCVELGKVNRKLEVDIEEEALRLLRSHPWPGNVRQLQNFMERLVVLSEQVIIDTAEVERELSRLPGMAKLTAGSVPAEEPPRSAPVVEEPPEGEMKTLDAWRAEAEREALTRTLERCGNNRTKAARVLGISRRTLYNKLEEHGLA